MSIISVRDNENNRWKRNAKTKNKTTQKKQKKKQRQNRTRGDRSYNERVRAKWPFCPFRLGFLQLICKTSLIFKLNLELAFSIILKQRQLYESMLQWSDVSKYQTFYPFWYAPTTFSTIANNLVCIQNSLSLNCRMFLIKTLYQFVKDSFVAPSVIIIKSSNILQKDSAYPKTFYLNSFLLSTSTCLWNRSSHNKKSQKNSLYTE